MSKSEQLRVKLGGLDAAVRPSGTKGSTDPVAPKRLDGSDRFGGYPPE